MSWLAASPGIFKVFFPQFPTAPMVNQGEGYKVKRNLFWYNFYGSKTSCQAWMGWLNYLNPMCETAFFFVTSRYCKSSSNLHHLRATSSSSSPSSKSVKSLSALATTPSASASASTWSRSLQKSGRRIKKRSLNALFDAVGAGQAVRQKK